MYQQKIVLKRSEDGATIEVTAEDNARWMFIEGENRTFMTNKNPTFRFAGPGWKNMWCTVWSFGMTEQKQEKEMTVRGFG